MSKYVKKTVKIQDLHVDLALNGRDPEDVATSYDLESMEQQILLSRRIIQPIVAEVRPVTGRESEGEKLVVLAGNRRTLAGQRIVARPDAPQDVVANLHKVEVLVYSDLTDEERYAFVFDQGSQKGLADHEIVTGIWRMYAESYFNTSAARERILTIQWHNLAKLTGGLSAVQSKLAKVAPGDRAGRLALLKAHFHGTLDNQLLAVYGMGDRVKRNYLLTLKKREGLLREGEKPEFEVTTKRVTELSKAKNKDKKEGSGWNAADGGTAFNALVQQFIDEDNGTTPKSKSTRPTVDDLLKCSENYSCQAVAKAIKLAAGVTGPQVAGLEEDSDRLFRMERVLTLLGKAYDDLPEKSKPFARAILDYSPARFQEYLRDELKINVNL